MNIFDKQETRIALISDIHGNLPALESVLEDIKKRDVSEIWNLGDIVGYYTYPNEVIERLISERIESISGNYDIKVLEFRKKKLEWEKTKSPEKYFAFEWNDKNLSDSSRNFLRTLPRQIRKHIGDYDVLLVHGSPLSQSEYLTEQTPHTYIDTLMEQCGCDVIVAGHTHKPMTIKTSRGWVVNPGSVGRPEDDVRASYALLRFGKDSLKVKHFNVPYDIEAVVRSAKAAGMPQIFMEMIEKGLESRKMLNGGNDQWGEDLLHQKLKVIESFAIYHCYEKQHSRQVWALAVRLFDELKEMCGLEQEDRFLLEAACILHDIGWERGQKGHHKSGMDMILNDDTMPLDKSHRKVVALVVRSHRKKPLTDDDKLYAGLDANQRRQVDQLGAILRIADGLDRCHCGFVTNVRCSEKDDTLVIYCIGEKEPVEEIEAAMKKSDLFVRTFEKNVEFQFVPNKAD